MDKKSGNKKSAERVSLSHGGGGEDMQELIGRFRKILKKRGEWENLDNDSATLAFEDTNLVFTTDSFVVSPIFFPGGNIGDLSVIGTINDLAVMGAEPLGVSLSLIIEEGFEMGGLEKIMESVEMVSEQAKVPVVTGDTKVMEKGKVDGIVINTAGVGSAKKLLDGKVEPGDKIIVTGSIADHGVALLSRRFDFETGLLSDSKPVLEEMRAIRGLAKQAKDPTRGGLAAALNEFAEKGGVGIEIQEKKIPLKREVLKFTELLGLDPYEIGCEGRIVAVVGENNADEVLGKLKKFNPEAEIIGEVVEGKGVVLQTKIGKRVLHNPKGKLIPRIC